MKPIDIYPSRQLSAQVNAHFAEMPSCREEFAPQCFSPTRPTTTARNRPAEFATERFAVPITPTPRRSWLYGFLRGQFYAAPPLHRPHPSSTTPNARMEHYVRLRLHGTHQENTAALKALVTVLEIRDISHPYRDRPPSTLERIYIDAVPKRESEESR